MATIFRSSWLQGPPRCSLPITTPPPGRALPCPLTHLLVLALAAPTPLTDQFMSSAWPKDGVPWVPGSQEASNPSGLLTIGTKAAPHRTRNDRASSPPSRTRAAGPSYRTGGKPRTADESLGGDESGFLARFACEVPGCGHRFPEARLLALHLRMGHNDFDLEKMKAAREGTERTHTLDGVSITAPIDVGGHVRLAK